MISDAPDDIPTLSEDGAGIGAAATAWRSRRGAFAVALLTLGSCGWAGPTPVPQPATKQVLAGICEASTVVEVDGGFVVGDNEADGRLFRYDRDLRAAGEIPLPTAVEDIEAMTPSPGGLLVVGSHSRSKKGDVRPARHAVLDVERNQVARADFSGCPVCMAAESRPPKEGGISVEGAAWWQSALWLGLRSPLDGTSAMLLELRAGQPGVLEVAQIVRLDLGGRGVRELRVRDGVLWVLAGPLDGGDEPHALFRVGADGIPVRVDRVVPTNAEGLAWDAAGRPFVVRDGDGKPGKRCKEPSTWTRLD